MIEEEKVGRGVAEIAQSDEMEVSGLTAGKWPFRDRSVMHLPSLCVDGRTVLCDVTMKPRTTEKQEKRSLIYTAAKVQRGYVEVSSELDNGQGAKVKTDSSVMLVRHRTMHV